MTVTIARQMIAAEILKLRRNRAIMGFALVLTLGIAVLMFGYNAVQHAQNPTANAPAGGMLGFNHGVRDLAVFFGMLTAILIGAEAGTADLASGVFRDLVVTGRSRLALFAVRLPAAVIVTLALSAATYVVVLAATFGLADGTPTPGLGLILQGAGWIAVANVTVVALSVGVGALTGSRAVTLTAVIGWQVILTNLVVNTASLGSVRELLLTPAVIHLQPVHGGGPGVAMTTGVAVIVLCGWFALSQAVGAWRTRVRDA